MEVMTQLKDFFGQSPQGYQRQVMDNEEQSSNDVEKLDQTVDSQCIDSIESIKKSSVPRHPTSSNTLLDLVRQNIVRKTVELQNCIHKVLYETAPSVSHKYSPGLSESVPNRVAMETETTISDVVSDFTSYVTDLLSRLQIDTNSIDERILPLLCEKRVNEQLQEITRRVAREEALNIQQFAATGDIRELLVAKHHLLAVGNKAGDTPLHLSLLHQPKNIPLIQTFLDIAQESTNPLNCVNNLHQTCLHLAVKLNPSVIPFLLLHGADPNVQDRFGNTAIHLAVEENNEECLLNLLRISNYHYHENNYPRLSTLNYAGYSPLHLAIIKGHESCIQHLCRSGSNLDQQEGTRGRSALHLTIEYNPHALNNLITQTCDVNIQDYAGNTPLHLACAQKLKDAISTLIRAGANPYILNDEASISDSEDDYSDDEEMNDEMEERNLKEYNDYFGKSAIDIAKDDQEILHILTETTQLEKMDTLEQQPSSKEESSFDKIKYSASDFEHGAEADKKVDGNITAMDSGYISSEITFLRETTIKAICEMLDPPSKEWEKLAICIDIDEDLRKADSPTRTMIKHFQQYGNVDVLMNALEVAQLNKVLDIVRNEN